MRATRTLTFLFTDIEDSSRHWDERPTEMGRELARHDAILTSAITDHGGTVFKHTGDGVDAVFGAAPAGIAAAVDAQRRLIADGWRVRMGLHSGAAEERDGDFFGPVLNRCARLRDAAHGGQIVCSSVTADLARDELRDARFAELGLFRLRGLARPELVFQVQATDLTDAFPPLPVDSVSNVPVPTTSFVGRERELEEIDGVLAHHRLVTLVGLGGVGKTRLAVAVAARTTDRQDSAWFVNLAAVADDTMLGGSLAQILGVPSGDPTSPLLDQAIRSLERRAGLLVLDNCEHIIDVCADLCAHVLARCPKIRVLATSREALRTEGEHTIAIGPLPDALRLFEERAGAVRTGFRIDGTNRAAIEEICTRLDRLPLAIELAAARIAHLAPQQIAARLDDRFRLLTGPRRKVGRQQTLEAAMDWSYNLLSEDERRLLHRLSVFVAPFRLEGVEGIWDGDGDAVDLLGSLVAKSLIVADLDADPPRYRLLETVRAYAWRRLVDTGEVDETRTRHRDWVLADLEATGGIEAWLGTTLARRLLDEQPDIAAALEWTRARQELAVLGRLLAAPWPLWVWSTHLPEARAPLDAVLGSTELDPSTRADCLALRAYMALMLAEPDVLAAARRATEEPGLPDGPGLAWAWGVQAIVEATLATAVPAAEAVARRSIEESVRIIAALDVEWREMRWWELLARIQLGDLDDALTLAQQSLRAIPDRERYWHADTSLRGLVSGVHHIRGRDSEAAEVARPVLDDLRAADYTVDMTFFMPVPIGVAFALDGDVEGARNFCARAAERLGTVPLPLVAGDVVLNMAALAAIGNDFEKSSRLLAALIESGRRGGYPFVLRSPMSGAIYRHYVHLARAALSPERARAVRDEGREMPLDEALAYGLA